MTDPTTRAPAPAVSPAPARWIAGVLLIMYGWAKITGAQFLVLDSEIARPMGEVDGFWLTWYYFGFSAGYKYLIALSEIAGGLLLLWPRTALAGGLVLLPVTLNIVALDLLFGIDFGAQLVAWVILICVLSVIHPHLPRLREAILGAPSAEDRWTPPVRGSVALLLVVASAAMGWCALNVTVRAPTQVDGVWRVIADSGSTGARPAWQQAFFELNRAHMLVLRAPRATDAVHHFEIDSLGTVRVWSVWLSMGDQIGEGQLLPSGEIDLTLTAAAGGGHLRLERAPLRRPGR